NAATVSILDANKATVSFKTALSTVAEGNTDAVVVTLNTGGATLANSAQFNLTTTLGTAENTDFTAPGTTVTFAAGSANGATQTADFAPLIPVTFAAGSATGATQTISLAALSDLLIEGNETLTLGLTVNSGAATVATGAAHAVTITDGNTATVSFQAASSSVLEGHTDAVIVVLNTGGATLEQAAKFNVTTTLGTAEGVDFTVPNSVTFTAGS